jgi:AAA+ ATPase superfamily predicted ATPase
MKFYNREKELLQLSSTMERSKNQGQLTVMVGRRRIGKTSLLKKSVENSPAVYLFVAKKSEILLCREFVEIIKESLDISFYGEISRFKDVFSWLMDLSENLNFTLIIDEFQEFLNINSSIFSDMQNVWDSKKNQSKINLIVCGSIYSLMKKIFEDSKEPLFSRATAKIHVKPFETETLKEILTDYRDSFSAEDLLAFYAITGGIAKYVENLVNADAFHLEVILDEIFQQNSLFLDEGKNVLIEEFGKDYAIYFSVLSLIATSKTSRPEIESILEMSVGGYLEKLENDFGLIKKVKPIFSKPSSRQIKYSIEDNFLNFWFRFIFKYRSAIEIENFELVKNIVKRDYSTFIGKVLEKYFKEKMIASKKFTDIGTYWEKGNLNEIDIVAINEIDKKIVFAEVKLNKQKISLPILQQKAKVLVKSFKDYQVEYLGLSLEDM